MSPTSVSIQSAASDPLAALKSAANGLISSLEAATTSSLRLSDHSSPLPPLYTPYVLDSDQGETFTIVGSGSIMRYLATNRTTANQVEKTKEDGERVFTDDGGFAVIQTRAREDEVVPAHFHARTHDTFVVTKGKLKVWMDDQCRILLPGDIASVPPKTTHCFQVIAPDTEFLGIIAPGTWISMFGKIGEPYNSSPTYPSLDPRPFPVGLFIEAIKSGEDVVPQREYKYPEVNEPEKEENTIPTETVPYYLRADTGPKYLLNSQSCTPMINSCNTNAAFSLCCIAGLGSSETYPSFTAALPLSQGGIFLDATSIKLKNAHQLYRIMEGKVEFRVEGGRDVLTSGENIMIPAGKAFRYRILSAYARMYVFSGKNGGLEKVFEAVGRKAEPKEVVGDRKEEPKGRALIEGALELVEGVYV